MTDLSNLESVLRVDLHCHTLASGHAFNTLDELLTEAGKRKLTMLGISDHGPNMTGAPTHGYFEMASRLPSVVDGISLRFGCEANILNVEGTLDLEHENIRRLDYLLAGLHARTSYPTSSLRTENTKAIISCITAYRPLAISHPYTVEFPILVDEVASAAAAQGVALEVNLSRMRRVARSGKPSDSEVVETSGMLHTLTRAGGGFLIGSDAHHKAELRVSNEELALFSNWLQIDLCTAMNFRPSIIEMVPKRSL